MHMWLEVILLCFGLLYLSTVILCKVHHFPGFIGSPSFVFTVVSHHFTASNNQDLCFLLFRASMQFFIPSPTPVSRKRLMHACWHAYVCCEEGLVVFIAWKWWILLSLKIREHAGLWLVRGLWAMTRSGHLTWHLHVRATTPLQGGDPGGLVRDHQRGLREGGDPGDLYEIISRAWGKEESNITTREELETISGAWEKSAATDSAEPNSKQFFSVLAYFCRRQDLQAPIFLDANVFGRQCFWMPMFLETNVFGRQCFWMPMLLDANDFGWQCFPNPPMFCIFNQCLYFCVFYQRLYFCVRQ